MMKKWLACLLVLCLVMSHVPMTQVRADAPEIDATGRLFEYDGHTYQVFETMVSWHEAKAYCESQGGHLAVITSEEEQLALEAMKDSDRSVWIGGYYDNDQWNWVTGEAWEYEYWGLGEPNGYEDDEKYVSMWPTEWNDLAEDSWEQDGFICEWDYVREEAGCYHRNTERTEEVLQEPSCSEWGLVCIQECCLDCGQIILSMTEEIEPVPHAFAPNGICLDCGAMAYDTPEAGEVFYFNGHMYQIFTGIINWNQAKAFCEELNGHLATVTTVEEQAAIMAMKDPEHSVWIGGYLQDEQWKWVTGEAWEYEFWGEGEPNNADGNEEFVSLWPITWNDLEDGTDEQSGFICEWDYDASETEPCVHENIQVVEGQLLQPEEGKDGLEYRCDICWDCRCVLNMIVEPIGGWQEIHLTIPEANELGASMEHNTYTEQCYYVTGVIVEIRNSVWGNLYIADEYGNTFYVYGLFTQDGVRYDSMDPQPAIGDTITVCAGIGQYGGVPQMKNATLVEHVVQPSSVRGDLDNNGLVDTDDAIYLLYFTLFGDDIYAIDQPCDYDGSGEVDTDDAIYLLYYSLFGEEVYPLN